MLEENTEIQKFKHVYEYFNKLRKFEKSKVNLMNLMTFQKKVSQLSYKIPGHLRTISKKQGNSRTFQDFPGQNLNSRTFQDFPGQWSPCEVNAEVCQRNC